MKAAKKSTSPKKSIHLYKEIITINNKVEKNHITREQLDEVKLILKTRSPEEIGDIEIINRLVTDYKNNEFEVDCAEYCEADEIICKHNYTVHLYEEDRDEFYRIRNSLEEKINKHVNFDVHNTYTIHVVMANWLNRNGGIKVLNKCEIQPVKSKKEVKNKFIKISKLTYEELLRLYFLSASVDSKYDKLVIDKAIINVIQKCVDLFKSSYSTLDYVDYRKHQKKLSITLDKSLSIPSKLHAQLKNIVNENDCASIDEAIWRLIHITTKKVDRN